MTTRPNQKFFYISFSSHLLLLLILLLGFDFSHPIAFEHTNKQDVINAVILGDSIKSKILPEKQNQKLPQTEKEKLKVVPKVDKDKIIALDKKKKEDFAKKQLKFLTNDLLTDIKKQVSQRKKQQNHLKINFEKTLQEKTEQSMRQQILEEEFHSQAKVARETQGEINKYKVLIIQAISDHWIIPPGANRKLKCRLMIRLAKSGTVLNVQVIRSSGDRSLDSSARKAVLKASPLPMPQNNLASAPFREFVLDVKPENIDPM